MGTEMKHTPGPWVVQKSPSHNGYSVKSEALDWDNQTREVASVFMSYGLKAEERRGIVHANARLIAAAPEMMEALRDIAKQWPDSSAAKTARSAIAKATTS